MRSDLARPQINRESGKLKADCSLTAPPAKWGTYRASGAFSNLFRYHTIVFKINERLRSCRVWASGSQHFIPFYAGSTVLGVDGADGRRPSYTQRRERNISSNSAVRQF